ncbi:MAG: protoheme IX farnesyltransferase [Candidatus Hydrogenedens sp.]|nr:protoheme IX farnesyltransferase [Candidatus Hydrogenedens sp.]
MAEPNKLSAYVDLTKPRILTMVLVTGALGYCLPAHGVFPIDRFLFMLLGTGLSSAGAGAFNHFLEREIDKGMDRTKNRPLPSGTLLPWQALMVGIACSLAGVGILWYFVNGLSALLAASTIVLYAIIYTPMKRVSWLNTPIGAIPGAIPPMIGWAAATGSLEFGAWVLFAILFLWQHPHFYAIAWMFKDDYARAGFKMLPVVAPDGKATFRQSWAAALVLIPVSLWPTFVQMTGWLYFLGAFIIGIWFLSACVRWRISGSVLDARRVLRVSVIYLPVLLLLILVDAMVPALEVFAR